MEVENGVKGENDLRLVNRLDESRSPYVSPYCVTSRPTMRTQLKGFSHRSGDTWTTQ